MIQQPSAPPVMPSNATSSSARRSIGCCQGSTSVCQTVASTSGDVVVVAVMVGRQHAAVAGHVDELDAVGGLERRADEDVVGCAEGDLAVVEAQHALPAARLLDVMGGDQQRAAVGGQAGEQVVEQVDAARVEADVGL